MNLLFKEHYKNIICYKILFYCILIILHLNANLQNQILLILQVNNESMTMSFDHLGIQCVKKKDIEDALKVREEIRVDPFRREYLYRFILVLLLLTPLRLWGSREEGLAK